MTDQEYLDEHGYFVASNENQLHWAKDNLNLISLSNVLGNIGESSKGDECIFLPICYSDITNKDQLPVFVWKLKHWKFRSLKGGDVVSVYIPYRGQEVEITARVDSIRPGLVEVSVLNTHQTILVKSKDVQQHNQD